IRERYKGPQTASLLSLDEARRRKFAFDWRSYQPPVPSFTGVRVWDSVPLEDLASFIDWTPFFHAWELKRPYPALLEDRIVGPRAKELFDDAQKLLAEIVKDKLLTARGVAGFFPANSVGEDIEVYPDASRNHVVATFCTLRQQMEKPESEPELA